MSNKKQDHIVDSNKMVTAVESIIQKINNVKPSEFCSIETIKKWCNEAKELERYQHAITWDKSMDNLDVRGGNIVRAWDDFDEYYKETYE